MIRLLAIFGASMILLVSCGSKQKTDSATQSQASTSGTVLAKVNGSVLTYEDLRQQLPAEYRDQLRGKDLKDAIDTWVNTELLAQLGEKMGIDKGPEMEAIMRFRKADAIARRLVDIEVTGKSQVTAAEIDSAYNADREKYKIPEDRMRASHIIVESKEEADAIYGRLNKGDDFAKLAGDYSKDRQSATQGGDMGYFTAAQAKQFDPDFAKAVTKLKVGEYSQPVKTSYGYHIIKLTDVMAAGSSLDSVQVKTQIQDDLKKAKQSQTFAQLLDSLKNGAKIETFTPPGFDLEGTRDSVGK
jgi:parvulin-like peptidyl-prolyl isomerase